MRQTSAKFNDIQYMSFKRIKIFFYAKSIEESLFVEIFSQRTQIWQTTLKLNVYRVNQINQRANIIISSDLHI